MRCKEVSMGKVMVLVVGVFMLAALAMPAYAYSYTSSWSSSPYGMFYNGDPYGVGSLGGIGGTDLSSIYGASGPFGVLSSMSGFGSPFGGLSSMMGYSPFSYGSDLGSLGTGSPGTDLGQVSPSSDLFSNIGSSSPFSNIFGGLDMFQTKTYGTPPTAAITKTLVGQTLSYSNGNS